MAILSKIRERSMFLILVIGLALFAFVLDPSTISDFFNSSKVNEIGEINGEVITRQEFATALDNYRSRVGSNVSEMQASNAVWNNLVREKIYKKQLEGAGITLGEQDMWNQMIQIPYIQNNPQFHTSGVFNEEKFKQFLATQKAENTNNWRAWQNLMTQLKSGSESTIYTNLVGAGLGASLKEGETQYLLDNTKIDAKLVYVPFSTVSDSLVKVTESDVSTYVKAHANEFQVEESRDLVFVKFDIKPTAEDETAIKNKISNLINDKEEYSAVTKGNITVQGMKNTEDLKVFFDENGSDLPLVEKVEFKNGVPSEISEKVFTGTKGDVFGPYKDNGFYKLSKVTEVLQLPDSVKASHILVAYQGAQRVAPDVTKNQAQAKTTADSLLTVIKRNPSKLAELAKQFSTDKGSGSKGGDLGWFAYNTMTPNFRDFCFENKKGALDIVETPFGYHIIKIENQKNFQKAVKMATYGRRIIASEATENATFQNAEAFAQDLSKDVKEIYTIAKEKGLSAKQAVGVKALDENVPNLGKERQIVTWAFSSDTKQGDYKRFDVEGGYVVALLTTKTPKGLMSAKKAMGQVRSILLNEKKAKIIADKMNGTSIDAIAKENNSTVRTVSDVNLKTSMITGVGTEPKVVGAMVNAKENELYNKIIGSNGVFAFVVNKKQLPTALPNYDSERNRLVRERANKTFNMYEALKKATNVEDNRKTYYGIQ